jgi:hypothetical protein
MNREALVYVDLDGVPHLMGRLWARTRKNKESATFEYTTRHGWKIPRDPLWSQPCRLVLVRFTRRQTRPCSAPSSERGALKRRAVNDVERTRIARPLPFWETVQFS